MIRTVGGEKFQPNANLIFEDPFTSQAFFTLLSQDLSPGMEQDAVGRMINEGLALHDSGWRMTCSACKPTYAAVIVTL